MSLANAYLTFKIKVTCHVKIRQKIKLKCFCIFGPMVGLTGRKDIPPPKVLVYAKERYHMSTMTGEGGSPHTVFIIWTV